MNFEGLGKRVKEERLRVGLTQEALAETVGLSAVYIGQIERGERKLSLESLVSVANALNVSVESLLRDSTEGNINSIITELVDLLRNHTYEEISLVTDIVKTTLSRLKNNTIL
jgi:transcriptional regulator with XRE-family HTH domain